MKRLRKIVEVAELTLCCILIAVLALVVVGACAALVPVHWILDWSARRSAEGDKWTS